MPLSGLFEEALTFSFRVHSRQVRKGGETPYISHLLAVAAIALEYGADEEVAIAALLHDSVEDHGPALRGEIRTRFGPRVLGIVDACSDAEGHPKPPWKERKVAYIRRVASADPSVQLVSASDKLHNLRAIARDFRTLGEDLWTRFTGGRDGTLWYYREVVAALTTAPPLLLAELRVALEDVERLLATSAAPHSS
ncbi:MAG: bifunctional (p)ppGpp synthetase/guanosine-3',5'-bis(diphosphate) 3'-pyrophosphohydrolase [Bryobacteraceae bacterium]|nr:bifunctional (p)ppGpp synthetase/guanosine-3',5'-bis(diphosphate) 3'-pyrophosphohydrolase [Bryobacteraceae bacterium]